MDFSITSPSFQDGGPIPREFTCEGADRSPPLVFQHAPAGTRSLALIVDDPDAPDPKAPKMTWVHWVLYGLPATCQGLDAGVTQLPPGTKEGVNDWKRTGYGGPCPPIGQHRYFHTLYALDLELADLNRPTKAALLEAMQGHVLAKAQLMGTYVKQGKR
jgi:hypothetical protein